MLYIVQNLKQKPVYSFAIPSILRNKYIKTKLKPKEYENKVCQTF